MIDLIDLSATALAAKIRRRAVSPLDAVDAYLRRIEQMRAINAVVTLRAEQAREEARTAESRLMAGDAVGPLCGVPFTAKDVIATAGDRTTCGSLLFADRVTERDATAVARLKAAGAILLGKTNTSEFALDPHTDNRIFGPTHNPWNLHLTPGGSSGGESAAVATGCSALGIGSDFGGSLRWPAQCTGLVAMRPTHGLVPGSGTLPSTSPLALPPPNSVSFKGRVQVLGPLARSCADLDLALRIMSGPDGIDPAVVAIRREDLRVADLAGLRYAWCTGEGSYPVREDVAGVVEDVARRLAQRGWKVAYHQPAALLGANVLYGWLRAMEGLEDIRAIVGGRTEKLSTRMRAALEQAAPGTISELLAAGCDWDVARARASEFFSDSDVLLMPVASTPAFPLGLEAMPVEGQSLSPWQVLGCCRAISLFGLPAAVVPCGRSREGLPLGVQVVGPPYSDYTVLGVAELLAQEFGGVRPPTSFTAACGADAASTIGAQARKEGGL